MLVLVEDVASKKAAQKAMERTVKAALTSQGLRNIGFRSGNADEVIHSNGDGQLWCAFGAVEDAPIPRRWNAFGVFDSHRQAQIITVEINVPTESNSAQVAGFFARDPMSGRTYLMHDGGVGGGQSGVGGRAFLAWSRTTLVDVGRTDGSARPGIIVSRVGAEDLPSRLWHFVQLVRGFKDAVRRGDLDDEEVRSGVAEWDRFNGENAGRRRGTRNSKIDYISYHGDVVQLLYEERKARCMPGERVLNSPLIDLYVRSSGVITEIYEVKTNFDRQSLYTAIGQLITHSVGATQNVKRVLVIPDGPIASDLQRSIASLQIVVRRFTLKGGRDPKVALACLEH